jgi:hypothetical protein
MTYKINKTDGNLLAEIPDGTYDTVNSSLTLIGKNVTAFGEIYNENLVKLLENFSSSAPPEHPIIGQLWYNSSTGRIYVYDGTDFRASGGPLISAIRPTNLVPGDIWVNNDTNQLWFYDGTDLTLAGPIYTTQQKLSGFKVENIIDSFNRIKTITKMYVNGTLLGIFSSSEFTPALPIEGYSGTIGVGFNASTLTGLRFDVTVSKAEGLVTADNVLKKTADILFTNENGKIDGSLEIQSADGLRLLGGNPLSGSFVQGDSYLKLDAGKLVILNNESSRAVDIRVTKAQGGAHSAIYIDPDTRNIRLFDTTLSNASVNINGTLRVSGDLIIDGSSVTISSTVLQVEDKNIELNVPSAGSATDLSANGGGITLHGTNDKEITYSNVSDAWNSSINFNLAANKAYSISSDVVLTRTELGSTVTTSHLETFGSVTVLNMASGLRIINNTVQARSGDLELTSTTGNISANNRLITNVRDIDYATSNGSSAANKRYVDSQVYIRPLTITADISDFDITTQLGREAANNSILELLNATAAVFDKDLNYQGAAIENTIAKVTAFKRNAIINDIQYNPIVNTTQPTTGQTQAFSRTNVAIVDGALNVIGQVGVINDMIPQVIPAPTITFTVDRVYKKFEVKLQVDSTLAWEFVTDYSWKGAWSSATLYIYGDVVTYLGREYFCTEAPAGTAPFAAPASSPGNWTLFTEI